MAISLHRKPVACDRLGCGKSWLAVQVRQGTVPPPIADGRNSLWVSYEIDAVIAAIVAGATDDQRRALVAELVKLRADCAPPTPEKIRDLVAGAVGKSKEGKSCSA